MKDVTINLRHLMDFGDENYDINVLNIKQVAHNIKELLLLAGKYV